jgi:glycosyltransferase involved in cell wall biosynthesis
MEAADKPLVSVVMIFLNAERFILEAIESVRAQTHGEWELLLVDDGSTDGSSAIAKEFAAGSDGKIRHLEHEGHSNLGMSASRNLGIQQARGEFLAFLDADDLYKPEKLEKQLAILRSQPHAAMVYGSPLVWRSWSEAGGRDSRRKLGVATDTLHEPPSLFIKFLTRKADTPATCSVLLRTAAVRSVGGWEQSFRGMFEDQAFFAKLCLKYPVYVESGCWDYYRQHDESCCKKATAAGHYHKVPPSPSHKTYIDWLGAYLRAEKVEDETVWSAFRAACMPYERPFTFQLMLIPERVKRVALRVARATLPPALWSAVRDQIKQP